MADQDIGAVFNNLATQMANVSSAVGTQGIAQVVTSFDGDNKQFKSWIKSVEKYAALAGIGPDRIKMIAYQSSRGAVSDFIQRYLNDHPNNTWDQLKAELTTRFAEITDPQHAFMLLRKVKQNPTENVQLYAEKLLALAEEAFVGQPGGIQPIEAQLVGFFIDGLAHDYLKMKVMRDNPATLGAAVNSAMNEQNLRKRFDLRAGRSSKYEQKTDEPMDVDHYRPVRRCFKCKQTGHLANKCTIKHINFVQTNRRQTQNSVRDWTQVICWNCGQRGHYKRHCKEPLKKSKDVKEQEN